MLTNSLVTEKMWSFFDVRSVVRAKNFSPAIRLSRIPRLLWHGVSGARHRKLSSTIREDVSVVMDLVHMKSSLCPVVEGSDDCHIV